MSLEKSLSSLLFRHHYFLNFFSIASLLSVSMIVYNLLDKMSNLSPNEMKLSSTKSHDNQSEQQQNCSKDNSTEDLLNSVTWFRQKTTATSSKSNDEKETKLLPPGEGLICPGQRYRLKSRESKRSLDLSQNILQPNPLLNKQLLQSLRFLNLS